jgi:HD-like signal output (HDOD) protein
MYYRCSAPDCENHDMEVPKKTASRMGMTCPDEDCGNGLELIPTTFDCILYEVDTLPASMQIIPRLRKLLSNDNASVQQVTSMIRKDSGLVTSIIKRSNTLEHSSGLRVSSLEEAINMIGFQNAYNEISSLAVGRVMSPVNIAFAYPSGTLWARSIIVAVAMEEIAKTINVKEGYEEIDPKVAYTCGLVHLVGLSVIDNYHCLKGLSTLEEGENLNEGEEHKKLGFTHYEIGAEVLKKWHFSELVCNVVRMQYVPTRGGGAIAYRLATILNCCKGMMLYVYKDEKKTEDDTLGYCDSSFLEIGSWRPTTDTLRVVQTRSGTIVKALQKGIEIYKQFTKKPKKLAHV